MLLSFKDVADLAAPKTHTKKKKIREFRHIKTLPKYVNYLS